MQSIESILATPEDEIDRLRVQMAWKDLDFFSQWAFREKYDNAWFHTQWYNAAQNPEVRRAINIAPRNSGKTTAWSKKTPLWLLGRDNNIKILLLSRTSSRAMANLRFIRQNIESNTRVKMVFPTLEPSMPWSDDEIAVKNTRNDGESSVLARGLGGSITGFRADILCVDDLIDKTNVGTDLQRAKVSEFWDEQVLPTLNPDGRVFIVGTRYSNKDWYARMMESEGYKDNLFIFPAFKVDENKELILDENNQPISYWPQRWSTQRLLERKQEVTSTEGSIAFASQYMCDPSGFAGQLFKSDWLRFYTGDELIQHYGDLDFVMSVDPNISAEAKSDNTAIVTIAVDRKHNDVYVLDIFAQPLDFMDQVKKLRELATKTQLNIGKYFLPGEQHIRKVGIESIAYQKALSATGYTMGLPVQEVIHGRTDKVTRLLRIQPHIENGRIKFPNPEVHRDLKWWPSFLDEYLSFPRGRRDDMCLTGETIIETIMGGVRLDSIKIGDMVLTRSGYRKVLWSGLTGIKQVYQLNLIDGRTITGTANHPIYINNVFIRLDAITGADYIWSLQQPSFTMEEPIEDSQIINNEVTESIINVMINGNNHHDIFTKIFGSPTMEKYQKDSQSTTSMETHSIMTQPIYLQCQEENTMECISGNGLINQRIMRNELNISKKYNIKQQNGINLKKEESGIEPITQLTHLKQRKSLPAKNVENNLRKIQPYEKLNSVQRSAVKNTEENQSECANVSFVKTSSSMLEINENEKPVLKNVRVSCIPKLVGINAVYNIEIEDEHEYFANGILVHNCDALEIAISVADLTGGGSAIPYGPGPSGSARELFNPDTLGRGLQPVRRPRI